MSDFISQNKFAAQGFRDIGRLGRVRRFLRDSLPPSGFEMQVMPRASFCHHVMNDMVRTGSRTAWDIRHHTLCLGPLQMRWIDTRAVPRDDPRLIVHLAQYYLA